MFTRRLANAYSSRALLCGVLALTALIWSVWMQFALTVWPSPFWFEHRFARTVDSPLLALEFSRSPAEVQTVFQQNDPDNPDPDKAIKVRRSVYLNIAFSCVYVPLCAAYLFVLGWCYHPGKRWAAALGFALSIWVIGAWSEYCRLLSSGGQPIVALAIFKWSLLALSLILVAVLILGKKPGPYSTATRRLLALTNIAAGLLIGAGLCFGVLSWVAAGQSIFAATICFNLLGLLGPLLEVKGTPQKADPHFCEQRRAVRGSTGNGFK